MVLALKQYGEFQALNKINNFYDYEKVFESIWRKLGKEVLLEANLSYLPVERRKNLPKFRGTNTNKAYGFSEGANDFQISPITN